ncbi:MAG: PmoA family protein [Akkermansiaceae bacterium]
MDLKLFLTACLVGPVAVGEIKVEESQEALSVMNDGKLVLTYHKAEVDPPKGVDKVYRRSGFIHPVNSPKGGAVTGVHPDDHYHHLGIWHAWVKTTHGKDKPDFWNLKKKSGRVRFVKVLEKSDSGFVVEQEQVAYKGEKLTETVVLREKLAITVKSSDEAHVIDYVVTETNVSDEVLKLPAYRYGGPLAWRGPLDWNKGNSEYLTSAGKKRADSHQSRADWVAVYGPTKTGEATLTFLGHPSNHDAPQRLRTWPDGKMFLNWVPIQEKPFEIKPEQTVTWKYRLVVSDGGPDKEKIDQWFADYAK